MAVTEVLHERITNAYAARLVRYAPHARMSSHAHDEHGVSLILDGELVEEAQHQSVEARSGWVVRKPAGVLHANRFGSRGALLLAITLAEDDQRFFPREWRWQVGSAGFVRAAIRALRATAIDPGNDAFADLLAELEPTKRARTPAPWLRRVHAQLQESIPPSVTTLARAEGVHPVYLARAFRAAYGMSIREYRAVRRVRRAVALIATTRLPLAQIALDCDFVDHAHMCREFRRVSGWKPSLLRR